MMNVPAVVVNIEWNIQIIMAPLLRIMLKHSQLKNQLVTLFDGL